MPRKPKPVDERDPLRLDGFARAVERALEHIGDSEWLGRHSPLAAPYLLGPHLEQKPRDETTRGRVLRELLLEAIALLPDDPKRVLAARCFVHRDPYLTNAGLAMRLGLVERTFYRLRVQVIVDVANELYGNLLAPLRLEKPPRPVLVGRADELSRAAAGLRAGRLVYLCGGSGLGKSTLAARVAQEWGAAAFWYTVRLSFNDRLDHFLFALAFFLSRHGAQRTWRQLIADSGAVDSEQALALLRYDLSNFAPGTLLLCIDDVDLLQPERVDHARILHLIDELRPLSALLLVGQRIIMESDDLLTLKPLQGGALEQWHVHLGSGLGLSMEEVRRLTGGVPVLLASLLLLHAGDPGAVASLLELGKSISVESAFLRIWRKLSAEERLVLGQLAVLESAAPADLWSVESNEGASPPTWEAALGRLGARDLVLQTEQGEITVAPYLRAHILESLTADEHELLNQQAAYLCEQRGDFTQAVHHWVAGHRPYLGLWLWFRHRRSEINRGQASHALTVLASIPQSHLPDSNDQVTLRIVLAELYLHTGRTDEAEMLLGGGAPVAEPSVRAYLHQLQADTVERLGQSEQALALYRQSLSALLGTVEEREVSLRNRLVYLHTARIPNLPAARREAMISKARAELYHGTVEEMLGNLTAAHDCYAAARRCAEAGPVDLALLASVYSHMGRLLILEARLDEAAEMIGRSISLCEERGDTLGPLYDRINLAYALEQAGSPERALLIAQEGLAQARRMRHAYLVGGLAAAAAEASLALGRIEEAESLALEAAQQEEEWFEHWALVILARVRSRQQLHTQAQTLAEQALQSAQAVGNPYSEAYCLRALGDVCRSAGKDERARDWFARALAQYAELGMARECSEIDLLLQV